VLTANDCLIDRGHQGEASTGVTWAVNVDWLQGTDAAVSKERDPPMAAGKGVAPPSPHQRDPEALPDSTFPHGPCPRCGRHSNFGEVGWTPLTYDYNLYATRRDGTHEPVTNERVSVLQCMGCHQNVVVVEEIYVGGVPRRQGGASGNVTWHGIYWWPTPGMRTGDPDISAEVADAMAEGHRCLAVNAPRAAVTMFRAALALVVEDKGSAAAKAKPTLYRQLEQMGADGDLDAALKDFATEVRVLGNAGAHPATLDPVSMDDARELSDYMAHLLQYLYVMPARVQRSKVKRSAP
jgi:hypothetical protein